MNRKAQIREENVRLLAEAHRSDIDPTTGKLRCLSCGNIFGSYNALASHLQKHNGINSVDFKPTKIVGTSQLGKLGVPISRPSDSNSLGEFIQHSMKLPRNSKTSAKQQKTQQNKQQLNEEKQDPVKDPMKNRKSSIGKSRPKLTATKRLILIDRVLTLTQELESLEVQIQDPDMLKKEKRRIQGRQKSASLELHHALVSINQKLSFRQLIMLEFLFNDFEEIQDPYFEDSVHQEETEVEILEVYDEIDRLFEANEVSKDQITGQLFIKKPVFLETLVNDSNVTLSQQRSLVNVEKDQFEKTEELFDEVSDEEENSVVSSDSDDELWGFGDVLSQWAKKAQFKTNSQTPNCRPGVRYVQIVNPVNPVVESESVVSRIEPKIEVVHTRRVENTKTVQSADSASVDSPQTRFIRPHLLEKTVSENRTPVIKEQDSCSFKNRTEKQENPKTLEEALISVFKHLNKLQQEELKSSKSRKWMISGFSEVLKALNRDSLILVILANGLDSSLAPQVSEIQSKTTEKQVSLIQALSRKKLGQIYHPRKKMSVIGILKPLEGHPMKTEILKLKQNYTNL